MIDVYYDLKSGLDNYGRSSGRQDAWRVWPAGPAQRKESTQTVTQEIRQEMRQLKREEFCVRRRRRTANNKFKVYALLGKLNKEKP